MFGIIVTSRKAGTITTQGQKFIVSIDYEGWVPATSSFYNGGQISTSVKQFVSKEAATKFATNWTGHPWWCKPIGFEVIELEAVTEPRVIGYRRNDDETRCK